MTYDEAKVDEAVLAVLFLSAFDDNGVTRAWKGMNWESTNRLFECGFISYPRTPSKSVVFTPEGLARAQQAAEKLFGLDLSLQPGLYTTGVDPEARQSKELPQELPDEQPLQPLAADPAAGGL